MSLSEKLGFTNDQVLIVTTVEDDYSYGRYQCEKEKTFQELVKEIEDYFSDENLDFPEIDSLNSFKGVLDDVYSSGGANVISIETEKERDTRVQDERRKELESIARGIATKHNVGIDSVEFINAVKGEIDKALAEVEHVNNPEVAMEHFAACRFAGVGQDVYFDDMNYSRGKAANHLNDMEDVLEWLAENCPLLWAKYQESKNDTN